MDGFYKAGLSEEISDAKPKQMTIDNREFVIFRSGETFYTVENVCPHQHFGVFHQTGVVDGTITCPMHGWKFDLNTGKAIAGSGRIRTFETKTEDGIVWVKIPEAADSFFR